jgi:hypothetical protein
MRAFRIFTFERDKMTASVIAFPKTYTPRPSQNPTLPRPKAGIGGALLTICGEYVADPLSWYRTFRVLIWLAPKDDEPVEIEACQERLGRLAIDFSRACFGEGASLLQMLAVLESPPFGVRFYTVLLEVPDHAQIPTLVHMANEAFAGLVTSGDLPCIVAMEADGYAEAAHLIGRTFIHHES